MIARADHRTRTDRFGSVLVSRLLSPEDYGLVAMVMAITGFAHLLIVDPRNAGRGGSAPGGYRRRSQRHVLGHGRCGLRAGRTGSGMRANDRAFFMGSRES